MGHREFLGLTLTGLLALAACVLAFMEVPRILWVLRWILVLVLLLLGTGVFNYNRSLVVVAVLALASVYSTWNRRLSPAILLTGAVVLLLGALALGTFRTIYFGTQAGEISVRSAGLADYDTDVRGALESVMRGPQYGATAIGALDSGMIDRQPDNLLNDILAPVPRLGKSFRDATTSVKFSYVVRGDARFVDTAPPLLIEILMTVGPLFILPTFLAFGVFVGWVERRWVTAQSPLTTYCWMFLGLWSGYLLVGLRPISLSKR